VLDAATPNPEGTRGQGDILRIVGKLGWALVCPVQDRVGWHWIFKRELGK
jgi:hypothetical protein